MKAFRIKELDPQREELTKYIRRTAEKMGESAMVLNIFTKDYARGLDSLLQFSLCVMLDKPIYLMAPEGTHIPEHVKKIASAIEFYKEGDKDSMHSAAMKLMTQAAGKSFPT